VDFIGINAPYVGPRLHAPVPNRRVDIWGVRTRYIEHKTGGYWDFCDFPLRDASEEEIARWPLPSPDNFDYATAARRCRRERELCVYVGHAGWGCVINRIGKLVGMEKLLMDLLTDDPGTRLLIERKQQVELAVLERTLDAAEGAVDLVWLGEDLSTQRGPMISPELYRKHIKPWHQQFVTLAKAYGLPVMFHSCGACSWVFGDLIEMGVDAVDTLQPEAAGMGASTLKTKWGDRLAFHGAITTGGVMAHGSPEAVADECRRVLDIMMPGGGYCFAPSHQLQDNTPTANALAMYQTAQQAGVYAG
jgi:uroporphyrinogen decarboxylase